MLGRQNGKWTMEESVSIQKVLILNNFLSPYIKKKREQN